MYYSLQLARASALFFLTFLTLLPSYILGQGAKNALQLDGINDYVEFNNNNRGITDQITVEAWIKTNSLNHHHVVSKYDRDPEIGFQLLIQYGKAGIAGRDGSGYYRFSGYSSKIVADNNWHHLAGVVQDGKWKIYVDGVLENQFETGYTRTVLTNDEKLLIGNYYYADLGNHFYRGQVDEVRIWKKALSIDEIRQNLCKTLPADAVDLVAYFKLDNISGGTIVDHSPSKLNGRLMNTTPAVAAVTSGAPIGDKSVYRYTNNWNASLEMVTDMANFSVTKVDPAINGFHLYSIQSPPASTNGIGAPREIREYYGLFKVGEADKKYKVYFKQYGMPCGGMLYRRQDNTETNWRLVADTTSSPIMLYNTTANYGEFAATSGSASAVKISGPTSSCSGSVTTLQVPNQGSGKILWSTGETTSAIKITKSGTYWVEVTYGTDCIARDEVQVSIANEPMPSLPVEAFACYGEPVMLDATTEGAVYKWSNGETTPKISVTTPALYRVTISLKDCQYVREVLVSNDECPAIPNIITPNGDGKNDKFEVQGVEQNTLELKIHNRWGKVVYQTKGYDNSWTASDVPAGIYYYQLSSSRTEKIYKGWVEVVR